MEEACIHRSTIPLIESLGRKQQFSATLSIKNWQPVMRHSPNPISQHISDKTSYTSNDVPSHWRDQQHLLCDGITDEIPAEGPGSVRPPRKLNGSLGPPSHTFPGPASCTLLQP